MRKKRSDKIGNKISNNLFKEKINSKLNSFLIFVKNHYTNSFKILILYILFVLIGAGLLFLPISFNDSFMYKKSNNESFYFMDAIFISSSAFSNTGLSVTDISKTFSTFGQVIIYIWIQLGGFGLLSAFYLIGKSFNKIFNKKIINDSLICYAERGGTKISNTGKVLFSIFLINILIQVLFTIIFSIIFYTIPFYEVHSKNNIWEQTSQVLPMYKNIGLSIWQGMFLTCSSINNAGFDLFGETSLAPFRNDIGISVQFLSMFLFIFGGIGYIVIYDIWKKIEYFLYIKNPIFFGKIFKTNENEYKYEKPTISIFSKICLFGAIIIGIITIAFVFLIEYTTLNNDSILGKNYENYFNKNGFNANWSIIFNTLASRSAGFATINMNTLNDISKWLFIFYMFIGTSPASTGGGIRTTTFIVLIKSILSKLKGSQEVNIFKKRISKRTIIDAINIFSLSILICILLTILICILSVQNSKLIGNDITDFFFEASSAFGTTGFSTGVTSKLDWWANFPLIILMFFGQLGIINSIQIFANKNANDNLTSYSNIEIKLG